MQLYPWWETKADTLQELKKFEGESQAKIENFLVLNLICSLLDRGVFILSVTCNSSQIH